MSTELIKCLYRLTLGSKLPSNETEEEEEDICGTDHVDPALQSDFEKAQYGS